MGEQGREEQRDPELVPGFLNDMPKLAGLEVSDPFDTNTETAIFGLRNFASLEVRGVLQTVEISNTTGATTSLREVKLESVEMHGVVLGSLIAGMPNLESFEILIDDPYEEDQQTRRAPDLSVSADILVPLSSCRHLRKLSIHDQGDQIIESAALSHFFRACCNLELLMAFFARWATMLLVYRHISQRLRRYD